MLGFSPLIKSVADTNDSNDLQLFSKSSYYKGVWFLRVVPVVRPAPLRSVFWKSLFACTHKPPKRCSRDLWVVVLISSPSGWGQPECSSEKHILLITDSYLLRVLELRMSLILSLSHTAGERQNKASPDFKVYVFNSSMVPMSSKGLLRLKLGLTSVR